MRELYRKIEEVNWDGIMINQMGDIFLGLDIGGSSVKFGWGNCKSGLQFFDRMPLKGNRLQDISNAVQSILAKTEMKLGLKNIAAVGIGTPGTIEQKTGFLRGINPNLPEWQNIQPCSIIPKGLHLKCFADNDANLMTLAEASLLKDKTKVIGITIGSGIGCGFVCDSVVYHGANGYAMEIGHTLVQAEGALCNCGRKGCLEAYTSVNGMKNRITALKPDIVLNDMQTIIDEAKKHPEIDAILEDSIAYLAMAFANLIIVLDADALVIGGGVIELNDYPGERLIKKVLDFLPQVNKDNLVIKKAELGNNAGTMGAVVLAERCLLCS